LNSKNPESEVILKRVSNELNAELTPGLIHEVNNILTGIYFNLETCGEALNEDPDLAESICEINQGVERIKVDETSSDSDSDSSDSDEGDDNDPSPDDKDPPPERKGPPPDDDKPPRSSITAPWRPIKSPSSRSAEKKDRDVKKGNHNDEKQVQEEVSVVPKPRYNPDKLCTTGVLIRNNIGSA
jgi:hypothetical protein